MAVETGTFQVVMPAMGDSVVEGTILEWHKHEGDQVTPDDTLVEISTDKVDAEVPSPVSGTVVKIYAAEGDTVGVGAPLAEIALSGNGNGTAEALGGAAPEAAHNGNGSGNGAGAAAPASETPARVVDIVTPGGSESVTEGTILEWSVKVGDAVTDGQTVVEISTDKVDMELPAPADGTITEILAEEGATVGIGAVIARMTVGASSPAAGPLVPDGGSVSGSAAAPSPAPANAGFAAPAAPSPAAAVVVPAAGATPVAQRMAAGLGVNLAAVAGTARGGRITKDDVLSAAATVVEVPEGAQKIKGAGAALARYMEESRSIPTATSFRTLAVTTLDARRKQLKDAGLKVSFTHLIAYAIAKAATEDMPVMAHHYLESQAVPYRVDDGVVNLGLAVDVEKKDGTRTLMVPVIRDAGRLPFKQFLDAYNALVEKARTNTLTADDLTGANLSLTNPGGIGTVASVPRLMVGQGTIVATGSIGYPVGLEAIGAQIGAEKVMSMTSTYDHRIIQGAESGRFLAVIESYLQGEKGFYDSVFNSLGVTLPALPSKPAPALPAATATAAANGAAAATGAEPSEELLEAVHAATQVLRAYRVNGHLAAKLDPLGEVRHGDPALDPETVGLTPELLAKIPTRILQVYVPGETLAEALPHLRETYCGPIAYEIEHISSRGQRLWLREAIESGTYRTALGPDEQKVLLKRLTEVDAFERFMGRAYLGAKRFSVEGLDMTVPMIDEVVRLSGEHGAREVVIGMAHRGRVNVLAHNLGRSYESLFAEFEGANTLDAITTIPDGGTGDVKYHHGASGHYQLPNGESLLVRLESNPSHLEFVAPVVSGATRAAQTNRQGPHASQDTNAAVSVVLHGDASFPGQGVVAETLNLQALDGYTVGGTIHIIQNNQVGFTTDPEDSRSTVYASDMAKGFDVPIIHVNADDVEACISAIRLAFAFRGEFGHDVLIDLIGYRLHGHNEGDEPAYTQPEMYQLIKQHEPVRELFSKQLISAGVVSEADSKGYADAAWQVLTEHHERLKAKLEAAKDHAVDGATGEYRLDSADLAQEVSTAVDAEKLEILNEQLLAVPDGFEVNRKLAGQLAERRKAFGPEHGLINWAHAEALAFATLLREGIPLRLTGQDTERGTFSHRHLVLHDTKTGREHSAIQHLPGARATMELHNSPLSEMACIGFEYGYSQEAPETLVMWEAQFGDFANGAQVMIDQFIIPGLAKWGVTSRLTLLLPHGYEGAGPEHSSARLERFLQLAAEGNIRVANVTTPAQYFHLLRRQARIEQQRPLVIMTPKSLLRLPTASSHVEDLTSGRFQPVLAEPGADPEKVTRLLLCSGKMYYDIIGNEMRAQRPDVAIGRVELLYPFPEEEILALVESYPNLKEVVWVQEEPRNMGARAHMSPRLQQILPEHIEFGYVGRPERAASGEGYPAAHSREQNRIVVTALDTQRPISQYPLATPGDR